MISTKKLVTLALLAAFAIVGRTVIWFLPNIQPVTAIIILSGITFGPLATFLLAIVVTFLSNMILGAGIWSVWQIVAWGSIGIIMGCIGKLFGNIHYYIIIFCAIFSGYFYGFVISLFTYQVTGYFWPYYFAGLIFDTYHAIGNVFFIMIFYSIFMNLEKERGWSDY